MKMPALLLISQRGVGGEELRKVHHNGTLGTSWSRSKNLAHSAALINRLFHVDYEGAMVMSSEHRDTCSTVSRLKSKARSHILDNSDATDAVTRTSWSMISTTPISKYSTKRPNTNGCQHRALGWSFDWHAGIACFDGGA